MNALLIGIFVVLIIPFLIGLSLMFLPSGVIVELEKKVFKKSAPQPSPDSEE